MISVNREKRKLSKMSKKERYELFKYITANKSAIEIFKKNKMLFTLGFLTSAGSKLKPPSVQTYLPYMPTTSTTIDNITFNINTEIYPGILAQTSFYDYFWRLGEIPATVNGSPISLQNPFRISFGISNFWSGASTNDTLHPGNLKDL
jgi:hypothetical protein